MCTCQNCGKEFEPSAKAKAVLGGNNPATCSRKCNWALCHKRKRAEKKASLSGASQPTPSPAPMITTPKIETLRPPGQLEPTAQWIIDQQKERIAELKDELKEKAADLKKALEDKESLKVELQTAQSQIEAKPGALAGILSNPEMMNPIIQQGMAILGKIIGMQPSLEGMPSNPLTEWFIRQTEQVQKEFVALIQNLNKNPDKMSENLAAINRNLMSVSSGGGSSRGFGFGR